jgi:hypothetical protein
MRYTELMHQTSDMKNTQYSIILIAVFVGFLIANTLNLNQTGHSIDLNEKQKVESNLMAGIILAVNKSFDRTPYPEAKMYSFHQMELRPGVTGDELEEFFNNRFFPNWDIPGWKSFLLKGDRGEREGRYMLVHEMESVEMRNRYFPSPDEATEEWVRYTEGLEEISAELSELVSVYLGEKYTDYYVVGN